MIRPLSRLLALALIVAAAPVAAQVQPRPGESPVGAPTTPPERVAPNAEDREFAKQAMRDLDTEVQIATLATKQAQSDEVRRFAEQAAIDYGKARQDLERAVRLANVEEPAGPGPAGDNMANRLDDETTGAFDLTYVTQRAVQHKRMAELFKREADNGQSPPLRRFAAETLPLVEKNARTLVSLQKQLVQKHQSQQPPKGK